MKVTCDEGDRVPLKDKGFLDITSACLGSYGRMTSWARSATAMKLGAEKT